MIHWAGKWEAMRVTISHGNESKPTASLQGEGLPELWHSEPTHSLPNTHEGLINKTCTSDIGLGLNKVLIRVPKLANLDLLT